MPSARNSKKVRKAFVFVASLLTVIFSALAAKISHQKPTHGQILRLSADAPNAWQFSTFFAELRPKKPSTTFQLTQEELKLSFSISLEGKKSLIKLVNNSDAPLDFFNSMKIGSSMFPSATKIEVRDNQGHPFVFQIEGNSSFEEWTPLYLTSRAFLEAERKQQTLMPGEGFCKIVNLENYFGGSYFDFKARDFQARIRSRIYLDNQLQFYVETRSGWFDLPKELDRIPPPADC